MIDKMRAVVLTSGGLDSTTVLAMAKHQAYDVFSLSVDYGQRHTFELQAAKKIAETMEVSKHLVLKLDLRKFGTSALTDDIQVPKSLDGKIKTDKIPVTYVPARNTIFLSLALAWAETLEASDIFIGVNALDYSGYPDCRPEYIKAFEHMANLATKASVEGALNIKIHTPLINLTKAQIIGKGIELGVNYALTHSCYDPSPEGLSCGYCDSCLLRKKGFKEAGVEDPTQYV